MTPPSTSAPLPSTLAGLQDGIERGLHLGAQLYVSRHGIPVADLALGAARPGQPLTRDHLMLWLSSTKPLTAVAVARLWQEGRLGIDDLVGSHLPEFANRGKEAITVRHLLTHTAGIRMLDVGWPRAAWSATLARICASRLEPRWVPGRRAGYHLASSWFVLGELVERLSGVPFSTYIRRQVCEPLGMTDSWIGMPVERFRAYGERIAPMYDTAGGAPQPHGWESEERVTRPSPGGNGYGPLRELGRFYEALAAGGALDGRRVLSPQTVAALTARHRVGLVDRTFQQRLDWGLGFIVNSRHYGAADIPYGYGPHASLAAFGHSGYRSSVAFADPPHALVVALAVNGTPDEAAHRARFEALLGAIYEDLGLYGLSEE